MTAPSGGDGRGRHPLGRALVGVAVLLSGNAGPMPRIPWTEARRADPDWRANDLPRPAFGDVVAPMPTAMRTVAPAAFAPKLETATLEAAALEKTGVEDVHRPVLAAAEPARLPDGPAAAPTAEAPSLPDPVIAVSTDAEEPPASPPVGDIVPVILHVELEVAPAVYLAIPPPEPVAPAIVDAPVPTVAAASVPEPVAPIAPATEALRDRPIRPSALPAPADVAHAQFVPQAAPARPVSSSKSLPVPNFGHAENTPPAVAAAQAPVAKPLPQPSFSTAAPKPFTEDDELILQIEIPDGGVDDTIEAYGTRSGVYLPLGAITRFLDLAIVVSDDGRRAGGWFLDEKQTLALDLQQGTLTVSGRALPLAPGDAQAYQGELYLRAERFADILPLSLKVDQRAQTVVIATSTPFPFQQRLAREQSRDGLSSASATGPTWPRENIPWSALSFPLADFDLRAASDSVLGARIEADTRFAGDFAFMTARVFTSISTKYGLTAARIELGRRDPDAGLLGPLKATEFEIGDVATASLPLGLRSTSGRGFVVTNLPLSQASVFDLIDFRGELPVGNDVELYRNDALIGSTRTPINGQYEFLQVPVEYGLNVFRLVFYGPQGQRREEVRRIRVGDGRIEKGKLIYAIGAAQRDYSLINARVPNFFPGEEYGNWRTTLQVQYGVTAGLTATAAAAWFESDAGPRQLASAGVLTGLGGTALRLDAAIQRGTGGANGSGSAAQIGLGGKLLGASYTFTHAEYAGKFSDEVRSYTNDYLRAATEVVMNTTVRIGGPARGLTVPLVGRLRRIGYADGHTETYGSLTSSILMRGAILSSSLDYSDTAIPRQFTSRGLNGSFDLATMSQARTQYRASLDYSLIPSARLTGVSFEVDHAIDGRTRVRAGVSQSLFSGQTSLQASAARQFARFTLAFNSTYNVQMRSYDFGLRLGFSLGRDPIGRRVFMARPGLASNGAVAVRAYDDANGNGLYDTGEATVPGIGFNTGIQSGKTDARGTVFLGSLTDGGRVAMRVDRESLPDIGSAPVTEGVEIVPRAGRIHVANFGIVSLSEIEGTARFSNRDSSARGVSGLSLVLTDLATDKIVARVRTEMDGYFLFEQIKPGRYRIDLDADQAQRLNIRKGEAKPLEVTPVSTVLRQDVSVVAN